jgi:myo-inositol-1(or 4)-monophosphatase
VTGTPDRQELAELLALASRAAREAGELLRTARPDDIRGKTNARDLVTEWDLRSQELITNVLAESGIAVVGEEGVHEASTPRRWLVDPIDGTVNFTHGLPLWCVSIAFDDTRQHARTGVPLLGVVWAPLLGWWFEASEGGGARDGEGKPLRVSECPALAQALLATGFPYSADDNFVEWEHMQRRARGCRRLGSAALDLCLVARGQLDGYWERHLAAWDLAAGARIVVEAGGTVSAVNGGPFDAYRGEAVASNGAIHSELVTELEQLAGGRT